MLPEEVHAHVAIRDTLSRYNIAGDAGDTDGFVDCFTEDVIYRSPPVLDLVGKESIRKWKDERNAAQRPDFFYRHHLGTCRIDLVGRDEARARTYFAVYTPIGPDHCGIYTDVLRRQSGRWLIAERVITVDWAHENSMMVPPEAR